MTQKEKTDVPVNKYKLINDAFKKVRELKEKNKDKTDSELINMAIAEIYEPKDK